MEYKNQPQRYKSALQIKLVIESLWMEWVEALVNNLQINKESLFPSSGENPYINKNMSRIYLFEDTSFDNLSKNHDILSYIMDSFNINNEWKYKLLFYRHKFYEKQFDIWHNHTDEYQIFSNFDKDWENRRKRTITECTNIKFIKYEKEIVQKHLDLCIEASYEIDNSIKRYIRSKDRAKVKEYRQESEENYKLIETEDAYISQLKLKIREL